MRPTWQVIMGDILTTTQISANSIDLVVTSPPYNLAIEYATHNDGGNYTEYLHFTRLWLKRCYELLKRDGRICINVPLDKNKGGQQSIGADVTHIAKEEGFRYHSTVIWNEGNISRRTA